MLVQKENVLRTIAGVGNQNETAFSQSDRSDARTFSFFYSPFPTTPIGTLHGVCVRGQFICIVQPQCSGVSLNVCETGGATRIQSVGKNISLYYCNTKSWCEALFCVRVMLRRVAVYGQNGTSTRLNRLVPKVQSYIWIALEQLRTS